MQNDANLHSEARNRRKNSGGIEDVLLHLNAGMETLGRIIGQHGYIGLHDNLPGIHTGVDVMHRTTGLSSAGLESLAPSFHAGERRQKCRVNVQNAAGECTQQGLLHQAHKTGKTHDIDVESLELFGNGSLHLERELVFEAAAIHHLSRYTVLTSTLKNVSVGIIGKYNYDLGIKLALLNSVENRLAITAGTGTKYS